jgi:hypothetical protein
VILILTLGHLRMYSMSQLRILADSQHGSLDHLCSVTSIHGVKIIPNDVVTNARAGAHDDHRDDDEACPLFHCGKPISALRPRAAAQAGDVPRRQIKTRSRSERVLA